MKTAQANEEWDKWEAKQLQYNTKATHCIRAQWKENDKPIQPKTNALQEKYKECKEYEEYKDYEGV